MAIPKRHSPNERQFQSSRTFYWQRGFSEMRIFELEGFHARKHYIRQNAVQTGLVATAEEFRFCSAFPGYSLDPVPENLRG